MASCTSTLQEPFKTTFIFPFRKKQPSLWWKVLTIAVSTESRGEADAAPFVWSSEGRGGPLLALFICDGMYSRQLRVLFKGGVDRSHRDSCSSMQMVVYRTPRSEGPSYAIIQQSQSFTGSLLPLLLYLQLSRQESQAKRVLFCLQGWCLCNSAAFTPD